MNDEERMNILAQLKKKYPHHRWVYEGFMTRCKDCGMSSITPEGACETAWPHEEKPKRRRPAKKRLTVLERELGKLFG